MAQSLASHSVASLRAITYRISSTPTKQLPTVAAQIAGSIWNCKDILSLDPQVSKSSTEVTAIAHRFKTTLTSLLQDRAVEGRWAAVVLTKAAIEAGGLGTLSKSNGWVKSLIAILKKPDPLTTRQLAVITLTRIFMLTWDHSNLIREITTPALPAFISTCLSNVERERCSAGELEAVLEAFATLVPRHPTVFRTHLLQIKMMSMKILFPSSDNSEVIIHSSQSHRRSAARLLILLHQCAPKQGASDKWEGTWSVTIGVAHSTCHQLFRSTVEDFNSVTTMSRPAPTTQTVSSEVGVITEGALGLYGWKGIPTGSERLMTLILLLKSHLDISTADRITIRIGILIELIVRILSVTLDMERDPSKHNNQIPKDEREALFCVLPEIHLATLDLITSLLKRFEMASTPFIQILQESTLGVFKAEHTNTSVRLASYTTFNHILQITGPSMSKADVAELGTVVSSCCKDLLPNTSNTHDERASEAAPLNGTSSADSKRARHPPRLPHLTNAANTLLTTLATRIYPFAMPSKLRVQIERTAILARNKDALVALVLNPAAKGSRRTLETSLLPILAREYPDEPEVEALLRPRMPPVVQRQGVSDDAGLDGLEKVDVEDAMHVNGGNRTEVFEDDRATAVLGDGVRNGVFDSHAGREDELYSLTPPRNLSNQSENQVTTGASPHTAVDGSSNLKRNAEMEIAETSPPAKRSRTSPTIDPVVDMTGTGTVLPKEQMQESVESAHPVIAQSGSRDVSQSRSADPPIDLTTTTPRIGAAATAASHDDGDSDDSDFEMPPLTMEPDTDPEDDGEDEEEE